MYTMMYILYTVYIYIIFNTHISLYISIICTYI